MLRALRALDPALTLAWLQDTVALATPEEILRARNLTLRERPENVREFFAAQFRRMVPPRPAAKPVAPPLRTAPSDDPYGF